MQIQSSQSGPVVIVAPLGRIDHAQTPAFQEALAPHVAACTAGSAPLLIDFTGIEYISSVGLRALMLIARTVGAQKGRVAIAGLQPVVREVFEISRFHLVFKLYDTVEAGTAALGAPQ